VKKILTAFILLVFSAQTFYQGSIVIWFYAQRSFIIKNLCVNKTRPQLGCKGKCVLMKKLKETERQREDQVPDQLKQWVETSPCTIAWFEFISENTFNKTVFNPEKPSHYKLSLSQTIFHPPAA
jgi:hypothetical protein